MPPLPYRLIGLLILYQVCVFFHFSHFRTPGTSNGYHYHILADAQKTNLALRRPTRQSYDLASTGYSSKAVDGNRNSYFIAGSCVHAWSGFPTWWLVDLQKNYLITSIRITNRLFFSHTLSNFSVEVSLRNPLLLSGFPGRTGSPICVRERGGLASSETRLYDCKRPVMGRFLRLFKYNLALQNRELTFCEFEVFGRRSWRFESAKSSSANAASPGRVLQTVPGGTSRTECVRRCARYAGADRCRYVQIHKPSGRCHLLLLDTPQDQDKTGSPEWVGYRVVDDAI